MELTGPHTLPLKSEDNEVFLIAPVWVQVSRAFRANECDKHVEIRALFFDTLPGHSAQGVSGELKDS